MAVQESIDINAFSFGQDLNHDGEQGFTSMAPTDEFYVELITAYFQTKEEAERNLRWLFDGYAKGKGRNVYWRQFPAIHSHEDKQLGVMYHGYMRVLVSRFKKAYVEEAA